MLEVADFFGFKILILLMEKCVNSFELVSLKFFFSGDVAILASYDLFAVFCSPKRWKNWQVSVRYGP